MIADAVEGNERAGKLFQRGVDAFGGQYDGVLQNRLPTEDGVKNVHRYAVTRAQYRESMGRTTSDDAVEEDIEEEVEGPRARTERARFRTEVRTSGGRCSNDPVQA